VSDRPLQLTREQILRHRRAAGALDRKLPAGRESLRIAAWAGLQDSMPRAALLSIHARVEGTEPTTWEDPSLVQVWGPRFQDYVIDAEDLAVFTLARLPEDETGVKRANEAASRLHEFLEGRHMSYGEAGRAIGVDPNSLRYGTTTGRILIRWEGARAPIVWTVPQPEMDPFEARLEMARRYLRVFGPGTADGFAKWAGIKSPRAQKAFDALEPTLIAVRSPIGDAWILPDDEASVQAKARPPAPARLLPSGDAYFLAWGAERELLVPDAKERSTLWTSRVWPGALLVNGEIVGTWRRDGAHVAIEPWRALSAKEREAVEAEATSFPLPGLVGQIRVRWSG
jgi:DNA glycosylase AlkZ-like